MQRRKWLPRTSGPCSLRAVDSPCLKAGVRIRGHEVRNWRKSMAATAFMQWPSPRAYQACHGCRHCRSLRPKLDRMATLHLSHMHGTQQHMDHGQHLLPMGLAACLTRCQTSTALGWQRTCGLPNALLTSVVTADTVMRSLESLGMAHTIPHLTDLLNRYDLWLIAPF
jgi:hypothetical protein